MLSHSQSEPQGHFNETDTESLGHRDGCGGFSTDNTQSYNSSKRYNLIQWCILCQYSGLFHYSCFFVLFF